MLLKNTPEGKFGGSSNESSRIIRKARLTGTVLFSRAYCYLQICKITATIKKH